MLNIAQKAAREAGRYILQSQDKLKSVDIKIKGAHDYVTEIDKHAELIIVEILQQAYPDHDILAEESGLIKGKSKEGENSEYCWIIDPIDGTTNFIHGIPHYAISIALEVKVKLEVAFIYDPEKEEEFSALRGKGAKLNGHRLRVSTNKEMEHAVIGTGFPFRPDQADKMDHYFEAAKAVAKASAGIRRPGAASLDLAYVAAGRFDGFWESGLQKWDIAAGVLLIVEAGGLISDDKGGSNYLQSGNIVCASPKIFKPLLQMVHA